VGEVFVLLLVNFSEAIKRKRRPILLERQPFLTRSKRANFTFGNFSGKLKNGGVSNGKKPPKGGLG
jgi:hypothetical protein